MENKQTFLTKLSKVQEELKAPKGQFNKFGNYNYRSAEDIIEAVKPLLFANGLVMTISDTIVNLGDRYYLEATVTVEDENESRQTTGMAREAEDQKGMSDSQITGSASSYSRKYALNGMFGIDDTKDDDTRDKPEPKLKVEPSTASKTPTGEKLPANFQLSQLRKLLQDAGIDDEKIEARLKGLVTYEDAASAIKIMQAMNKPVDETEEVPFP